MLWDDLYLILTLLVLFGAWFRTPVSFDGAVLLLVWSVMALATYKYGAIEAMSTAITGSVMCLLCLAVTFRHRHWLPWYLMSATATIMLWSALYSGSDPYLYKMVKNMVYLTELVAVVVSYRVAA